MKIRSVFLPRRESRGDRMPYHAMSSNPSKSPGFKRGGGKVVQNYIILPCEQIHYVVNFSRRFVQCPLSSCYRAARIACNAV